VKQPGCAVEIDFELDTLSEQLVIGGLMGRQLPGAKINVPERSASASPT
jgi:hypothetical protein